MTCKTGEGLTFNFDGDLLVSFNKANIFIGNIGLHLKLGIGRTDAHQLLARGYHLAYGKDTWGSHCGMARDNNVI